MDRRREAAGNFRRQPLSNFRDPITGVPRLSPSQKRERTFVDHVDDAVELLGDALSWCSGQARRLRGIQGDDVWAFAAREVTAKRVALAVLAFATGGINIRIYAPLVFARGADGEAISLAFRRLAKQWHPDRWVNAPDAERLEAETRFKQLNLAQGKVRDCHCTAERSVGG